MSIHSFGINQADEYTELMPKNGYGQWNLVVIAVDQFSSSRPSLIGLWLLITSADTYNLTLVPIYPKIGTAAGSKNISWEDEFFLDGERQPDTNFLNLLSKQLLWDEYLMIDQEGMTIIVNQFTQYNSMFSIKKIPGEVLPTTGSDFNLSIDGQLEIWQAVCSELATKTDANELSNWLDQVKPYIHSRFELKDILHQQNFQGNSQFLVSCEFPTLTLNTP